LFSATAAKVDYGARHYQQRSPNTSTVLQQLFQGYDREGVIMPYTMQDFQRDYAREHFPHLTPAERRECIARLPAAERIELFTGLSAAERREFFPALPAAERRELFTGLSAAERRQLLAHLPIEDILAVLPRKEIEKFLKHQPGRKR
jgi:Mg/Co/Ni transporter MgtE